VVSGIEHPSLEGVQEGLVASPKNHPQRARRQSDVERNKRSDRPHENGEFGFDSGYPLHQKDAFRS
jgi:hypothetical protein